MARRFSMADSSDEHLQLSAHLEDLAPISEELNLVERTEFEQHLCVVKPLPASKFVFAESRCLCPCPLRSSFREIGIESIRSPPRFLAECRKRCSRTWVSFCAYNVELFIELALSSVSIAGLAVHVNADSEMTSAVSGEA